MAMNERFRAKFIEIRNEQSTAMERFAKTVKEYICSIDKYKDWADYEHWQHPDIKRYYKGAFESVKNELFPLMVADTDGGQATTMGWKSATFDQNFGVVRAILKYGIPKEYIKGFNVGNMAAAYKYATITLADTTDEFSYRIRKGCEHVKKGLLASLNNIKNNPPKPKPSKSNVIRIDVYEYSKDEYPKMLVDVYRVFEELILEPPVIEALSGAEDSDWMANELRIIHSHIAARKQLAIKKKKQQTRDSNKGKAKTV